MRLLTSAPFVSTSQASANRRVQRDRFHSVLQIGGCLSVIWYHTGAPAGSAVWSAVELFFVLAGYNMFRGQPKEETLLAFATKRFRRLLAGIVLIWPAACWLALCRHGNAVWFAVLAPLQLHNFVPLRGTDWLGGDVIWIPLWFTAALFQLQVGTAAARKQVVHGAAWKVLLALIVTGLVTRIAIWRLFTSGASSLSLGEASILFWTPFAHVEAIGFGALTALGKIHPGRHFAAITFVAVAFQALAFHTPGFPVAFQTGFAFIWGYPLLALFFIALVDVQNPLARAVSSLRLPGLLEKLISWLSKLTFLAYAIHGFALFMLWKLFSIPGTMPFDWPVRRTLFVASLCVASSFGGAGIIEYLFARRRLSIGTTLISRPASLRAAVPLDADTD
ncbi:hypothetical protein DB347_06965 [Opitutaceae bacterium EW11]|nr:hypothetical protein DB347_06965 [Opitutaceae bacterium EW11]